MKANEMIWGVELECEDAVEAMTRMRKKSEWYRAAEMERRARARRAGRTRRGVEGAGCCAQRRGGGG